MAGESETTNDAPQSIDVAGAIALMGNLKDEPADARDRGEDTGEIERRVEGEEGSEVAADENAEGEQDPEQQAGEEQEGAQEDEQAAGEEGDDVDPNAAPKFWSAEDRKAWETVPADLRPLLHKYEKQRTEFVNGKVREAAEFKSQAQREVQAATAVTDQAAAWWQANGNSFMQVFADKWSQVNWDHLAENDPAEYQRLQHMRNKEAAIVAEANRRGQADIEQAEARASRAIQEQKRQSHEALAAKLPDYFGEGKAQATYDRLGKYLFGKGIPADRINAIHEAPIIELALNAMRFEEAQKKASSVRAGKTGQQAGNPARPSPVRVAPGPANRAGNRAGEAVRQAKTRLSSSGGADIYAAAELIRLNGL